MRLLLPQAQVLQALRGSVVALSRRRRAAKARAVALAIALKSRRFAGRSARKHGRHDAAMSVSAIAHRAVRSAAWIVENRWFNAIMLGIVCLAAVLIGVQTWPSVAEHPSVGKMEDFITVAFLLEAVLRVLACGRKPWLYLLESTSPVVRPNVWNMIDLVVVICAFIQLHQVALLRLLRLLRVLKLVRAVPVLRELLGALLRSMQSFVYVLALLVLLLYVWGILGVGLFRENDPLHFDDLGLAMLTLLQCATGDDWTDVLYANKDGCDVFEGCTRPPRRCWRVRVSRMHSSNSCGHRQLAAHPAPWGCCLPGTPTSTVNRPSRGNPRPPRSNASHSRRRANWRC